MFNHDGVERAMIKQILLRAAIMCFMLSILNSNSPVILKGLGWVVLIGVLVIGIAVLNLEKITRWNDKYLLKKHDNKKD